jgi:hypothetical protein
MSGDKLRGVLIPRCRDRQHPKTPLTDIMVKAPTEYIKFSLVDVSHAAFDGERAHGLEG